VTTPKTQFLVGTWLNVGDEFLQIDDTRAVEVEIKIPQFDIALVKAGAKVWLRPWSTAGREIAGEVTEVAPTALDKGEEPTAAAKTRREQVRGATDNGDGREPSLRPVPARREPDSHKGDDDGLVQVKASIPSAGRLLRPSMTGYAKISGAEMMVGEAYFRLCRRFLTVQLWAWVP
jgi:hypothetical protein